MKRRIQLLLGALPALVLGAGAALIGTAGPASAALPGEVTVTPSGGSLTTAPMVDEVKVDGACPATHAAKVHIVVLKPDSSVGGTIATNVTAGGPYSEAPFTVTLPDTAKSLGGALGGDPPDGVYQLEIRCVNATGGSVPGNNFLLPITLTGETWAAGGESDAVETSTELTAEPAGQALANNTYKLVAKVTPEDAVGEVEFSGLGGTQRVAVRNGVAELERSAGTLALGPIAYTAKFWPEDGNEFTASSGTLSYFVVLEPGIEIHNAAGDVIEPDARLEGGQKVKATVGGFRPGEAVQLTVANTDGEFADANAGEEGGLTEHEVTVPEDIADGAYALTFTGADSGVKVDFPFKIGEGGGDDGGGDSDGGDNGGGDNGGGDGDGDDGGAGGGEAGGAAGDAGGTGGGGSDLPLASTGSGVLDLALVSVLLMAGGGAAVYGAHRSGRLLTFGATPRG